MATKVSKIANLAFQVFNQSAWKTSSLSTLSQTSLPKDKLNQLVCLLNKIDGKDVGFDINWTKKIAGADESNLSAPIVYVQIMENDVFSFGIFVLRPGSRIPLHDHPDMFGLIKVIHGHIRCRSFSRIANMVPFSSGLRAWLGHDFVTTKTFQDCTLEQRSNSVLLTPSEGNFHELFTVGNEGAAFVDILAPPYDHLSGKRECHFYQKIIMPRHVLSKQQGSLTHHHNDINTIKPNGQTIHGARGDEESLDLIYLTETHPPTDYWCDSVDYCGPKVS